jgi:16S rRNA (guanine(966)-N(2))-methyltransferase RsmD
MGQGPHLWRGVSQKGTESVLVLRITSGEFRGRFIQTPPGERTRPTRAQLRLALFNSVQTRLGDARVLDLFAGSGSLGFEALSRGAASVTFVENAAKVARLIGRNADELAVLDRVQVIGEAVEKAWPRVLRGAPYDLVLADPPYAGGHELKLLEGAPWGELLAPGGLFCLEWGLQKSKVDALPERVPFLVKTREKIYGDSVLSTYERAASGRESGEDE